MTPYVIAAGLTLLASIVLFTGFHFSARSERPKLFGTGSAIAAAGLTLLWGLPWWVFSADRGMWAMPLFIAALFLPVSLLGLGIQLMGRACGASEESHNETLFRNLITQNDHHS